LLYEPIFSFSIGDVHNNPFDGSACNSNPVGGEGGYSKSLYGRKRRSGAQRPQRSVEISHGGFCIHRPKWRSPYRRGIAQPGTTRIEKFTLNNKTQATVIAAENATVTFSNPQTRKNVVMKMSGRVRDTWVFRNARWLKSQTKSLSQIVMMDGKRVQ
jgi:hypothetical protein